MADKTNEILNQLLSGQKHLESDVSELKTDVAELKDGQYKLKTDVAELKTDVSKLKEGQHKLEIDVTELKEGQKRTELFLLNMENRIMPIINATYEISKQNKEHIDSILGTQSKHSDKLENHELRILRLENAEQ